MTRKNISDLIARYEQMVVSGKSVYFDADEYSELAEYYDKLDDIDTARNIVGQGLAIHPANESLMNKYARFMIYDGRYMDALKYLNNHFSSYDFDQYMMKIECFLNLDLYAEAYELTAEVLNDGEADLDIVLSELGFLYLEAEYYDEALLYLEKSLEYDPLNREVLNDLMYAYEVKADFASAIDICNKILDIDPYSFETWLTLGKLYSLSEDFEKAIDAFDFALTLDDGDISTLKLKAHCLVLADRPEDAVEVLKQCLELYPEDASVYLSLADSYLELEHFDDMLDFLNKYESSSGKTIESLAKKAYAYLLKEDLNASKQLVDEILELNSESFEANMIAGELNYKLSNLPKAESFYLKALELREEDVEDVLDKLVSVNVKSGNWTQAIIWQKKLLETDLSTVALHRLALLYLEVGDDVNFKEIVNSLNDEDLRAFYQLFYKEETEIIKNDNRDFYLNRLYEAFDCRLLYKNIRF